mmetsp:Transcript_4471/g.8007  ORF Transcript_4471/g.8007 Transcript_4471/m.8007 type:complete len:341 (-) Transcript_4471:162-1184(-)
MGSSNRLSAIRRRTNDSMSCVASSVGCGAGFMVVSKSMSISRALLRGRRLAEASPRRNQSFSDMETRSISEIDSWIRRSRRSWLDSSFIASLVSFGGGGSSTFEELLLVFFLSFLDGFLLSLLARLSSSSFSSSSSSSSSSTTSVKKSKVAIIREEGSNGDREMSAAAFAAGLEPWDVTMSDLLAGRISLDGFQGIIFVGGFSYADTLDSAKGWAGTIRFNDRVLEQFRGFYSRADTWSLGICNGCQLMALLGWVPGASVADADSNGAATGAATGAEANEESLDRAASIASKTTWEKSSSTSDNSAVEKAAAAAAPAPRQWMKRRLPPPAATVLISNWGA